MLSLSSDQIHLWLVFNETIKNEHLLEKYRHTLLNEEERLRERRFYFEADQRQFLITRALVRTVLSRYLPIPPAEWQFGKNQYGRPEISHPAHCAAQIEFNLSHTQGLIVLAVSCDMTLGVDTENSIHRPAPIELAPRYFSSRESHELYALPKQLQADRFFHYWTLKEAYIKARGMGLAIPLDQFSFTFPKPQQIAIDFHPPLQDKPENWHFWLARPTPQHLLALGAKLSDTKTKAPQLLIRQVIPLEKEELIDCPWLKKT